MEEADKDWVMIKMVGGWVFLLVPAHPGSPGQRAVKRFVVVIDCSLKLLQVLLLHWHVEMCFILHKQQPESTTAAHTGYTN